MRDLRLDEARPGSMLDLKSLPSYGYLLTMVDLHGCGGRERNGRECWSCIVLSLKLTMAAISAVVAKISPSILVQGHVEGSSSLSAISTTPTARQELIWEYFTERKGILRSNGLVLVFALGRR